MIAKMLALLATAAFVAGLSGCNTVDGLGKDMTAGGSKIEREAAEHKRY